MAEEKTTADVGNSPVVWLTVLQAAASRATPPLKIARGKSCPSWGSPSLGRQPWRAG